MDFTTAKVIFRNLNGRWCESDRWESDGPSGSGNSDIQMDFTTAKVIFRNLNGRWCESDRWESDGSSKDGSVSVSQNSGHVGGIPADCFMADGTLDAPEEILFCDVGTDRDGNE